MRPAASLRPPRRRLTLLANVPLDFGGGMVLPAPWCKMPGGRFHNQKEGLRISSRMALDINWSGAMHRVCASDNLYSAEQVKAIPARRFPRFPCSGATMMRTHFHFSPVAFADGQLPSGQPAGPAAANRLRAGSVPSSTLEIALHRCRGVRRGLRFLAPRMMLLQSSLTNRMEFEKLPARHVRRSAAADCLCCNQNSILTRLTTLTRLNGHQRGLIPCL